VLGLLLSVALALFVCWRGVILAQILWTMATPYVSDRLRHTTSTVYDPLILAIPLLLGAAALVGAFMTSTAHRLVFSRDGKTVNGICSPLLAIEVPQQPEDIESIAGPRGGADRELMVALQDWDRGFIVLYSLSFIAIACMLMRGSFGWQSVVAFATIVLSLLTAFADWREDKWIDRLLGVTDLSSKDVAKLRNAGLLKWTFFALTLCSIAVIIPIIGWGSLNVQILSVASTVALGISAAGILIGVSKAQWRKFIEKSSLWFAVGFLLVLVMFVLFPDKVMGSKQEGTHAGLVGLQITQDQKIPSN
jgi:hypothetical protein